MMTKRRSVNIFATVIGIVVALELACGSTQAFADQLAIDFSDPTRVESTTAIVNRGLARLQPPVLISQYQLFPFGSPHADYSMDIGDGSNGTFVSLEDYLRFHEGAYTGAG